MESESPTSLPLFRKRTVMLLSLVAPGAGHVYLGHFGTALAAQAVWAALLILGSAATYGSRTGLLLTFAAAAAWVLAAAGHAWSLAGRSPLRARRVLALAALVVLNHLVEPGLLARVSPWTRYRVLPFVSASMAPTIRPGERIVVDLRWYRGHPVQRLDLVVFEAPGQARGLWVSRCVALPGDRVELRDGHCWVNGNRQEGRLGEALLPGARFGPTVLGQGEVFCLGDNSSDSRSWGPLRLGDVRGKALFTLRGPDEA